MVSTEIALRRLYQQRLSQHPFVTPGEVVAWLGAVQAQEYTGAKWSLGMRTRQATDAVLERAFTDGTLLRTHVMRPTWHFVTPADIRWMQELTGPRVNAANGYMYRQHELDDGLFARSNAIIARALEGGRHLTRAELGAVLGQAGIVAGGVRLAYIVMRAELDAIVCSGPRRGKQFTYALLDERAPHARSLPREAALAELTRRYFIAHGPATIRDFVWWSGLTAADARAGVEMAGDALAHELIDGQGYWFAASPSPVAKPSRDAFLLPTYDEFLVGYVGFDAARRAGRDPGESTVFSSTVVIGGQVVGRWKPIVTKASMKLSLTLFAPPTGAEEEAIAAAARRYAAFLGMPVYVE